MACIEYGWSPWPDISFVSRRHFSSLPASEVALDRTVVAQYPVDQQSWCFLVVQSRNTKKLMFWVVGCTGGAQLYAMQADCRWLEVQCNAMQCRQGTWRQVEVKKFILRRQLQESPGLMAVRSPPPEDVLQLWLHRRLTCVLFVCLFVAKCTMPRHRRLDCMVEWAKADLLQAALVESLRRHRHIWITLNWREDWCSNAIYKLNTSVCVSSIVTYIVLQDAF